MGQPKALLRLDGRTFLERILDAIDRSGIKHSVVVVGHHRTEIERAVSLKEVVFNPDYERGMSTSVQAGIRALPPGCTGAGVFLVDHPLVDPVLVRGLAERLEPGKIVVPVHDKRRGHPVFFAAALFQEILALSADEGLNKVVRRDPLRVVEVPVFQPGILLDVDTPQEFDKLLKDYR